MKHQSINQTEAWKRLQETKASAQAGIEKPITACGVRLDLSKTEISNERLNLLIDLLKQSNFEQLQSDLFSGAVINTTENRAAWHTALRSATPPDVVVQTKEKMRAFCEKTQRGPITDIVLIGIGGSIQGPQLAIEALTALHHPRLRCHFVANVDSSVLFPLLKTLRRETTLFIVASKTFSTKETMINAASLRDWLGSASGVEKHVVAITEKTQAALDFGIKADNIFPIWDWVGGRFSLWSAIGLPIALLVGMDAFEDLLNGAAEMDAHFQSAPAPENLPVLLALTGIWHRNFCDYAGLAVIPYHENLRSFPAYIQQLDMESNGKTIDRDGRKIDYKTAPLVFGQSGTPSEHSFFQWLHQGSDVTPVEFILVDQDNNQHPLHHQVLTAHAKAQAQALWLGRENSAEPHRHFNGHRPSITLTLRDLSARRLGALLALYEHKVFTQGALWNLNSFDQWGVELGKEIATQILNTEK